MDNHNEKLNVPPQYNNAPPQYNNAPQYNNVPPQYNNVPPQQYGAPPFYQNYGIQPKETQEQKAARSEYFHMMFLPTLLYGVLFTFCLYDNWSSITMPLFVIVTFFYCRYGMNQLEIKMKKTTWFYAAAMLLLGGSTACTGNPVILFFNCVGIVLLLICMLLHTFFDDSKWTFDKYFAAFFAAIFGAIANVEEPFMDAAAYQKDEKRNRNSKMMYVLLGIVISIPLLVVVVMLLYYADAVFAQFIRDIKLNLSIYSLIGIGVMYVFSVLSAYCGFRFLGKRKISEDCKDRRRFEPLIAVTALTMIAVVYVFFSVIQVLYLFWGQMKLPEGYTYASYAHEGFFQLLFVCMINVVLVLVVLAVFRKNKMVNLLLTLISACTYIMLASSAYRMYLYVRAYSLSFLRILVFWGLVLMAVLLVGIVIQIFHEKFRLFQYGLAVVTVCYLVLSFSHPDYWIAKYNLSQMHRQNAGEMDYEYLSELSTDAASVIAQEQGEWVDVYAQSVMAESKRSLRQYNFSVEKARSLFENYKMDKNEVE